MPHPVPIGDYESQVPVEEGLRRIIPQQSGASSGPGLEAFGGALQQLQQSEAANYSMQTLSQARTNWTKQMLDRQQAAQPGAPNFTPDLMQDYDKYVQNTVKGAPKMAQQFLTARLTELGTNLADQALRFEASAKQAHNETTAQNAIDAAGNEVMGNPSVFGPRLAEQQALVGALSLDPQVKDKLNQYATQSLSRSAVMGDIQRDPYSAMLNIISDKPGYYANLTPEHREQLMAHADALLHQRVADAERVHQLAKQEQQDNSDKLLKQGIVMSQTGSLTPGWVLGHSNTLEPAAMKYLLDEASGKKAESDIHLYVDLQTRAAHGEDVTGDATQALYQGRLSKEDWTKISDMGAKVLPNWFKRGTDYITTMAGYSELNPNIESAQMKGRMIDEWQDWATEHPKATLREAQTAYQDIVMQNMVVKIAGLPPLKYGVPGKNGMLQPDLVATKQRTAKAFQAGEITHDELDRQGFLIRQYEKALATQSVPK